MRYALILLSVLTIAACKKAETTTLMNCNKAVFRMINAKDTFFMANVFTPNADGKNDRMRVYGNTTSLIQSFELTVYDAIGTKVFATTDRNAGWDGKRDGKKEPNGTFIAHIRIVTSENTVEEDHCFYLAEYDKGCIKLPDSGYYFEDQFDVGTAATPYTTTETLCQ